MTPRMPPAQRGRLLFLGKLLVSSLLLGILFWRVDRAAFLDSLRILPLPVFLGCVGLYILGYVISVVRWQRLLAAEGIRLPLWRLALVYFEAAFFNLFLPTLIGGDLVRGYTIYRITRGHDASIASILVDRLAGFAALVLIALVALAVAYRRLQDPHVAVMILGVAAAFAAAMALLLNDRLKSHATGLARVVGLARFHARVQGLVDALQRYRHHQRALGQALILSALLQALIIVTYYLIGTSLNLGVPLAYFFLYVPLITVLAMLPISVAGLGVREGGVVYFFAKVGVEPGAALGMSLVWFSLSLAVSSLGGLAFLVDTHAIKRLGE
ncbi:MAG TPA: lysylphosphatidylglycerol synthase transmembrane domain-containing protein [Candidatus Methylomirabilis sp.]|nr:lysylphosphatidylglycerol synthase transmembrane domain-containing protein [Candidatus Methylomirabilis sp.]